MIMRDEYERDERSRNPRSREVSERREPNRANRAKGNSIRRRQAQFIRVLLVLVVVGMALGLLVGRKWGQNSGSKDLVVELETVQAELDTLIADVAAADEAVAEEEAWEEEKATAWYLRLVNQTNPISEDEVIDLAEIDGFYVDSRIYDELTQMLEDGTEAGTGIYIRSAYREWDTQALYFGNMIEQYVNSGYSYYESYVLASEGVAVPGESEHQLGLAVDLISSEYETLDEGQADTEVARWLEENSYKYGFILRYPEGKEDITGIMYESWHYRYVGVEAATEITELGITLEEYLEM